MRRFLIDLGIFYAVSSIFSANIAYPRVGSSSKTWVTAPISFPFCKIEQPYTRIDTGQICN